MKKVAILGATGSIGQQTLSVIKQHPDRFSVYALTAHNNITLLLQQIIAFDPRVVVVTDPSQASILENILGEKGLSLECLSGSEALCDCVQYDEVDIVVNGIVGFAGMAPALTTIKTGKRLLLANKEVFVAAGDFFQAQCQQHQTACFPLDSEHHALFECLHGQLMLEQAAVDDIESITLTASGGPFLSLPLATLSEQTAASATHHPTWTMGKKISVDSATLVNKAFEVIEAHYLFNLPYDKIRVLIHPQSSFHALVQFIDGSLHSQIASPDMRLPISRGLAWPGRLPLNIPRINAKGLSNCHFSEVDNQRYPCFDYILKRVFDDAHQGVIINAANEVAVEHFLRGLIGFSDIYQVIKLSCESVPSVVCDDLNSVQRQNTIARTTAADIIQHEFKTCKER